jgi:uncharacterized membrane protein
MNCGLKRLAEQILFACNVLIAFLLLFEDKLVIPTWLQTVGRMHPLILHFPIVILLAAMLMEYFRFKSENFISIIYVNVTKNLLLLGSLFAGVTVIMGLFLSQEEGYSGDTLQWHKWTGTAIFFLSSAMYSVHDHAWYKKIPARSAALITVVGLVLSGHYGANLTHGNNFILAPISSKRLTATVPLEEVIIFNDLIMPILEQKCVNCHNPDKLKGGLLLTDPQSILKGGKSGELYVPGNPAMSLLLQRVHLPETDKKRMPPIGRPQLTSQELLLLALWVKDNADFKKKLIDLPTTDSLRIAATSLLKPTTQAEDNFAFSAADEETVKKLNNDYRTVTILAKESPALAVNIYNRSLYTSKLLEELDLVKKQIVSLNLNKMPVKDTDLKSISKFENLRKLDLNFTDVTASGLKELTSLKHLKSLTLTGTKVDLKGLQPLLPSLKSIRTISLWSTGLSQAEIQQLQKTYPNITFIAGYKDDGKNPLRLNPPHVKNASSIFTQSIPLHLNHPIKGVDIRYTLDASEPDSINSLVFDNQKVLTENVTIKAKAFKPGWYSSDMVTFNFFKSTFKPDSVHLLFPLNRVHQADGGNTFFDHKLGIIGANNPAWANDWAGVKDNDMALMSSFNLPVKISSVGLHYMIEEDTGIFPPEIVEVWGGNSPNKLKLLTKFKPVMPGKGDKPSLRLSQGEFAPTTVTWLKIIAKPLHVIPQWHRKGGRRALLLVDEMFVN